MTSSKKLIGVVLVLAGWVGLLSCDAADRAADCHSVCSRWRDCFDSAFNVDKCSDTCESKAANNKDYDASLDACEVCIGDKSCIGSVTSCTVTCAPVVSGG